MRTSINYHDLLQINRAELETVERVYRILATRYRPDNQQTGDPERFRLLSEAYQALRDPVKRQEYPKQFERNAAGAAPGLSRKGFAEGIDSDAKIRVGILCLRYSNRRANPDFAALSLLDMENIMAFPRERCYLRLGTSAPHALSSRTTAAVYRQRRGR